MARSNAPLLSILRSLVRPGNKRPCARSLSTRRPTAVPRRPATSGSNSLPGLGVGGVTRQQPLPGQPPRRFKSSRTVEEVKSRNRTGPFSWKAGVLFVITSGVLIWYFEHEKERMRRKRVAEATKGVGKPKVGGDFELLDQEGRPFGSKDLLGTYSLIYFGFTHCPDICPEELDKMACMFDLVEMERPGAVLPVFITCDPERDTAKVLKDYLAEFHPSFVGLTGTYDQIKDVCKAYRVYFSTPQNVKPGQDYLVDHSIYFYLMDPDGDFVEALGRQDSPGSAAKTILLHVKDWKAPLKVRRERSRSTQRGSDREKLAQPSIA